MKESCWAHFNEEEQNHHQPSMVLHNVNTGIYTGVAYCAAQMKKYDKCGKSKTIITHFAHKTKLKLTLLTKCQSTTSFHLQGIQI